MKRNGHPTQVERLDAIAKSLKELKAVEHQRRIKAGPQLRTDRDNSCFWQGKLPTFTG